VEREKETQTNTKQSKDTADNWMPSDGMHACPLLLLLLPTVCCMRSTWPHDSTLEMRRWVNDAIWRTDEQNTANNVSLSNFEQWNMHRDVWNSDETRSTTNGRNRSRSILYDDCQPRQKKFVCSLFNGAPALFRVFRAMNGWNKQTCVLNDQVGFVILWPRQLDFFHTWLTYFPLIDLVLSLNSTGEASATSRKRPFNQTGAFILPYGCH